MRFLEFDTLTEILLTMKQNKLRSFLTGFAVSWGIFMLIILLGSGNGLKNGITSNFSDRATNSMMIWGGRTTMPYKGFKAYRRLQLTNNEVTMLKNHFKEIDLITGEVNRNSMVSYKQESGSYEISGIQPGYNGINTLKINKGRFINDMDLKHERKVIVLPRKVAELLFKGDDPLGKWVKVDGLSFQVVGIDATAERGEGSSCYIPLTTAQKVYHLGIETYRISFTVNGLHSEEANEDFGKQIRAYLGRQLIVHPEDLNSIGLWNQAADYVQTMKIFSTIDLFVLFIGICTLIAGLVGVGNIMVITVKERTREFGIRKSLGATPGTILNSILLESVVVTTLFGYVGMLFGIGILELISMAMGGQGGGGESNMQIFANPTVDLKVVLGATLLLIIAGLIAGYIPARKAVRIKPIEAMRAE
ncbi:MAG: ABC transporter permease [Bacteroidales bacterium]|nr:ABC transporter permease [Bacteroidales bacterium]